MKAAEAKERQRKAGGDRTTPEGKVRKALRVKLPEALADARDVAGKAFGVSGSTVEKSLRAEAPEALGSAADYVFAVNHDRRHLSEGAKVLAAGRYKAVKAAEAKERQKRKPNFVRVNLPEQIGQARDVAGNRP